MTSSASGTEIMPPTREPSSITPLARPRSRSGNHRDRLRAMFGKAPASPAPNRNLITTSERRPCAAPVSIVNADHHNTIRVSTRRGPFTSPSQPDGTSNAEYASVKALKTKLISSAVSDRSRMMNGAAAEMQMRSR